MKNFLRPVLPVLFILLLALPFGCSNNRENLRPGQPRLEEHDNRNIEQPKVAEPVLAWQSADRTLFMQAEQLIDFERDFRILTGNRREAYNINSFDQAYNSSWFTNRIGFVEFTPEQVLHDFGEVEGPDTSGVWTAFRPKVQGATPGFWIEDARGDQYIIKFDPPEYPELATGASAMGSRYFHACGYNVPQETIVLWRPEQLRIKAGVMFTDRSGVYREFVQSDLEDVLARIHKLPDGRIRSLASRVLDGKIVGPFSYDGRRKDDPNDWCPHEHRRELRGLYVVGSFINHYDLKDQNTLDSYVTEDGRSFVKHYLIDFGSTFGSNGDRPKSAKPGYANTFDLRDMLVSWFTLGLKKWGWEDARPQDAPYPSIGYFESEIFHPAKFDPIVPNPAFENKTSRDCFWGARIVMAWRDEHLKALIKAARFSDPNAEQYLLEILKERRDKIGRYWFNKVNPLDNFELDSDSAAGALRIRFSDLAVKYRLEEDGASRYQFEVKHKGKRLLRGDESSEQQVVIAANDVEELRTAFKGGKPSGTAADHLFEVSIRTKRNGGGAGKAVGVWIWYSPESDSFQIVGLDYQD